MNQKKVKMQNMSGDKCGHEIMDEYLAENTIYRFEGDHGVENLNKICKVLGYSEEGYKYGSSLERFLSDNPGACDELIGWITEQLDKSTEWKEALSIEDLPGPDDVDYEPL